MFRYVHVVQQDWGALGEGAVQYTDDTVYIKAPDTALDTDTNTAQFTDTDHPSDTLQAWDTDVAQTTDIQDTQAKH